MHHLLSLPGEIRTEIWAAAFANQDVSPEAKLNQNPPCHACRPNNPPVTRFPEAWRPLLTCRQLYNEAKKSLYSTMRLHLSSYATVLSMRFRDPWFLLAQLHNLTLYLHLDEDNRANWSTALTRLLGSMHNLRSLIIHNHMRPPMSYENLMDAVFFAAPLALNQLSRRGVVTQIHHDYIWEDVMFSSPFLGDIRCSDAIEEHSAAVEDLIADEQFQRGCQEQDLDTMTMRLVHITRSYEQPWFARLQRRRLAEVARRSQEAVAAAARAGGMSAQDGSETSSTDGRDG